MEKILTSTLQNLKIMVKYSLWYLIHLIQVWMWYSIMLEIYTEQAMMHLK